MKLLIQTRKSGIYLLKNNELSEWNVLTNKFLKKLNVYSSIQLQDKTFVLGTISNGLIYLNKEGQIEYGINQDEGLKNNTVLSLFEDVDNNIWAGLDNGISCVNLKSPVRIFNDDKGKLGTVYVSTIFKGNLYLGTNQGLFYKKYGSNESFTFIENTAGQVWNLFKFNDELFCGHHYGTFIINQGEANLIAKIKGAWNFRPIPHMKNFLLQGNYSGLYVLTKDNGVWRLKNKLEGLNNAVRYFEISKKNEVIVSHGYKGVYRLIVNKDYTSVIDIEEKSELLIGKSSSLIKNENTILYASGKNVFAYDPQKNLFVKDTLLEQITSEEDFHSYGRFVVDDNKKLWGFTKDNIINVTLSDITNNLKFNKLSIPRDKRRAINGFENISHIDKSNYFLGTTDGYLIIDAAKYSVTGKSNILLNSVSTKRINEKNVDIDFSDDGEFKYNQNSIVFKFSVPNYDKYKVTKYQYKLEGLNNQWSDWTDKSELAFENLSFGDYTFSVRAKVGNEITSNTISYKFNVNRPIYLSNLAIVFYSLLLVIIGFIVHKLYRKFYKRELERKQFENERVIVKINNEKLNLAIENKNRELAISTMSIIRKNKVLRNIRKELKSLNLDVGSKSVLKLIDKSLNDSKDWSFFEEAFNNVDNDFLEKIKKIHPNLTPNDLRFCTYLRLNLSSKEISQLLNITVKSVETRRYRLRKKISLPHEEGLVNYILKI